MSQTELRWAILELEAEFLMGISSKALLEAFYRDRRLRNLTDKTLDCYSERLAFLVDKFAGKEITEITKHDIIGYISGIIGKVSPATVNGRIRVFRLFFRWLADQGIIEDDPTKKVRLIKEDIAIKPVLTVDQIRRLCDLFERHRFEGVRNRTMFLTLFDSGSRVSEIIRLAIEDARLDERILIIQKSKSRKFRAAPITTEVARDINSYLIKWRNPIPGCLLFPATDGTKLREDSVYHILERHGKRHGLKVYPHMFRRSAATEYMNAGAPLSVVQSFLGHADPRTTMQYIQYDSHRLTRQHDIYSPLTQPKKK